MSALLNPSPPAGVSLRAALVAGTLSGVLAALLAPLAVLWLQEGASASTAQFSAVWVSVVALLSCIAGGVMYYLLGCFTNIPAISFGLFALPIVAIVSIEIGLATPPGSAGGLHPIALLVALVAVLVLPALARRLQTRWRRLAQ